jgi:hypothetical protein
MRHLQKRLLRAAAAALMALILSGCGGGMRYAMDNYSGVLVQHIEHNGAT